MSVTSGQEVLVVAPHPDDETFGCGGTIKHLTDSGVAVDVVFMTRGELGMEASGTATTFEREALARRRTEEAETACEILGVRHVQFLSGQDGRLREDTQLVGPLHQLFSEHHYRRIFCPWERDGHPDHDATFQLVRQAVDHGNSPLDLWLYEIWTPHRPNVFVPIDATIDTKIAAMRVYKTQLNCLDYVSAFVGLASYRSLFSSPSRYAEAFHVVRCH